MSPTIFETQGDLLLRSLDIEQDIEALTQMWRESNDQWPGTVSDGAELTPEWTRQWLTKQRCLETLVWDAGDVIAGYCSIWEDKEDTKALYVSILNVAPRFQKLGLARRMLVRAVEYSRDWGAQHLDLHTWTGNLKAVPLYKKCGFFWEPETSVHMLNFMPAILKLSAAQPFFARHDWYTTLQCQLTQSEDREQWQGIGVYSYQFVAGDEQLTIRIDRASRSMTAIETDSFAVSAIALNPEPARGFPTPIRWRINNRSKHSSQVTLLASGTPELAIEQRQTLHLAPGQSQEIEAEVMIAPDMAAIKKGKAAPALGSLLVINDTVLELGTGLKPQAAIEIGLEPEHCVLMPGRAQSVEIWLRNRLKQPVDLTIGLIPQAGLQSDWTQHTCTIAAEDFASVPVILSAETGGVYSMPITMSIMHGGKPMLLPSQPAWVFALAPGSVEGAVLKDSIQIMNEHVRISINREGATANIIERATNIWLANYEGYAGPPLRPTEFRDGHFDLRVEREHGTITAIASMASKTHPGLILHKYLTLNAGPLIRASFVLENRALEPRALQISHAMFTETNSANISLPLAQGIVQAPLEFFPGFLDHEQQLPTAYAARWLAFERHGTTLGMLWGNDIEHIEPGWGHMLTQLYDSPPQSSVQPAELWLYVGLGGWQAVERIWRRMQAQSETERIVAPTQQPIQIMPGQPIFCHTDEPLDTNMIVTHARATPLNGRVTLTLPEGWHATPASWPINNINWKMPHSEQLQITCNAAPGAYMGSISLQSPVIDTDFELPLICLGKRQAVEIHAERQHEQEVFRIDNGRITLLATPGFGGTISSLREGQTELLRSAFPEVQTLPWINPWFGGMMPSMTMESERSWPGRLYREHFSAMPYSWDDPHGCCWQGIRQSTTLTHDEGRGIGMYFDVLTTGGSPVIRLVFSAINHTVATRRISHYAILLFVQPGGSYHTTTLWGPDARRQQIKPGEHMDFLHTGNWAAAQNNETGATLALIAPQGGAGLLSTGSDGGHLELRLPRPVILPPHGHVELVGYLAIAGDLEEARRYSALHL